MVTFTLTVHGSAGVGKTRLGDTTPAPRLVLATTGEHEWTTSRKVIWDPVRYAPPEPGEWETCIVNVTSYEIIQRVFQWINTGNHPFESIVFDNLSEMQKRLLVALAGMGQPEQQHWGQALRAMEQMVREWTDLREHPLKPVRCIMLVVGAIEKGRREQTAKMRPMLSGQFGDVLPFMTDVLGYYYVDEQGARRLLIQPYAGFEAKDRTNYLTEHYGWSILNPNVAEMLQVLEAAKTPQEG